VMIGWFCGNRGLRRERHRRPSADTGCAFPGVRGEVHAGELRTAFFSLAGVVLAVTGAEALYADMGHFGRKSITRAWLSWSYPRWPSTTSGRVRC